LVYFSILLCANSYIIQASATVSANCLPRLQPVHTTVTYLL
jgi:hypothetical protein